MVREPRVVMDRDGVQRWMEMCGRQIWTLLRLCPGSKGWGSTVLQEEVEECIPRPWWLVPSYALAFGRHSHPWTFLLGLLSPLAHVQGGGFSLLLAQWILWVIPLVPGHPRPGLQATPTRQEGSLPPRQVQACCAQLRPAGARPFSVPWSHFPTVGHSSCLYLLPSLLGFSPNHSAVCFCLT